MTTAKTGEKCPQGGVWYKKDDASVTRAIGVGNVMPPCPTTKKSVIWVLKTPTGG